MVSQIITEDDLAVHMRQTFPTDEERDAAVQACVQAQSVVLSFLRRDDLSTVPDYATPAITLVMLRRAAAIFRAAGAERTSFSNGDVSFSLDPRILTGDDRATLREWRKRRRGTITVVLPGAVDA
jgi:hypothetical protein